MIKGKDLINKIKNKNFKENVLEKIKEFEIKEKKYIWDRVYDNTPTFILNKYGETKKSNARIHFPKDVIKKNNNLYTNIEDAEYEKIKREYEYQLRKATTIAWEEYSEDIDWRNSAQDKYHLYYIGSAKDIRIMTVSLLKNKPDYYYFPDVEHARKFKWNNKELIRKFFKVEEE